MNIIFASKFLSDEFLNRISVKISYSLTSLEFLLSLIEFSFSLFKTDISSLSLSLAVDMITLFSISIVDI